VKSEALDCVGEGDATTAELVAEGLELGAAGRCSKIVPEAFRRGDVEDKDVGTPIVS
jgi:hypothetical protein